MHTKVSESHGLGSMATQSPLVHNAPAFANRVSYQGVTYTICKLCFAVVGSGKTEFSLAKAEGSHHCPALDSAI